MTLRARLKALEKRAGLPGLCGTCKGEGWPAGVLVESADEKPDLAGQGCPECRRVSCVSVVVLPKPWPEILTGEPRR